MDFGTIGTPGDVDMDTLRMDPITGAWVLRQQREADEAERQVRLATLPAASPGADLSPWLIGGAAVLAAWLLLRK